MSNMFLTELASFIPDRIVGTFQATVTIEETANDELEITSHPVQQGASITDHSYAKPAMLSISVVYSDTPAALQETYTNLRKLQNDRIPMKVITGKRTYNNMLMRSLSQLTDSTTENSLQVRFELIEVFLVSLSVVSLPPRAQQAQANKTGAIEQAGKKQAGSVAGQEAAKATAEKERSVLSQIFG